MRRFLLFFAGVAFVGGIALAQDFDRELGGQTYANCAGCHQATGAGLPGVFPPLAGHTPTLVAAEGGRSYLIDVMLYGVQGEITVLDATYNGVMPGWGQFSDEQIAAVVNHMLAAWENEAALPQGFEFITPEEVAGQRATAKTAQEVYDLRQTLTFP